MNSLPIRLGWQTGKPVHVFSLEGCVEQDFLLSCHFDPSVAVSVPRTGLVRNARKGLGGILWLLERPFVLLAGLAGLVGAIVAIRSGKKREKGVKRNDPTTLQ